jgi:hypothetical protein
MHQEEAVSGVCDVTEAATDEAEKTIVKLFTITPTQSKLVALANTADYYSVLYTKVVNISAGRFGREIAISVFQDYAYLTHAEGFLIVDISNKGALVHKDQESATSAFTLLQFDGNSYLIFASKDNSMGSLASLRIIQPNGKSALWESLSLNTMVAFYSITLTVDGYAVFYAGAPGRGGDYLLYFVDIFTGKIHSSAPVDYATKAPIVGSDGIMYSVGLDFRGDNGKLLASQLVE